MLAPDGYATVKDAAEALDCSKATLYRMIKDGLPTYILRGRERGMYVRLDEVRGWLKPAPREDEWN